MAESENSNSISGVNSSLVLDEKDELSQFGVNVWSASQEALENQALNELNEFAKQTSSKIEEGELEDSKEEEITKKPREILVLEQYILKQEELKKQQYQKRLAERSKRQNDTLERIKPAKRKKFLSTRVGSEKREPCNDSPDHLQKNDAPESCTYNEHLPSMENLDTQISGSDSEYLPSEEDSEFEYKTSVPKSSSTKKKDKSSFTSKEFEKIGDDGYIEDYKNRLELYYQRLEEESRANTSESIEVVDDVKLSNGLKVPAKYWNKLYRYQQKGVKWLWSLHEKATGGLLGDEMGLGKTVQIIAFLYALDYSRIHSPFGNFVGLGPTIIVCPATVIHQWVRHFHEWAPEFRVAVLHQSGKFQGNKRILIREINENNGILVTTYLGILKYKGNLLDHHWYYLVLDEGHKIRNATAKVTVAVKQIRTPNRIMLTGSPLQNNLQELWSLFDFTNPGMLGTMNTFMEHFNNPIIQGGFANATPMQEATAMSVATALKNMISPFLLRRTKAEVQEHIELPEKSEQVLFCSLSDYQRNIYKDYLMSEHVNNILGRGIKSWSSDNYLRANMLMAITRLRKICNHPDLFIYDEDEVQEEKEELNDEDKFGYFKKSGKMIVVSALLKIWKKQKHRVLLFSQGRAMIKIFEQFLKDQGYKFLKMDGSTSVKSRQKLIDTFNQDDSFDVFLLTTKVGGLGVNLTGADRVIIYDPDWNPATDTQARERAWRIGQNKQVTIYRLISAGTIEEKMYQRQIWKQLLSNKILLDPKTHRAFKSSDLFDLFSLPESSDNSNPETMNIFHDSRVKIQEKVLEKRKKQKDPIDKEVVFSKDKIEKMKQLAQQLAKNIGGKKPETKKTAYQKELEEERSEKKKSKEELKKLSVQELLELNREKAKQKEDETVNKVDGHETSCSFSKALEVAETKSKIYRDVIEGKISMETLERNVKPKEDKTDKKKKEKKKDKNRTKIDISGKIDGEKVEGLVKTEIKKMKNSKTDELAPKDDFILNKLFSSKGVSGALEHDSVINGSVRQNNLRISTQASERANKALQAIKKSRLDNWRW